MHPHQHLLAYVLMIAMLDGKKWCLKVVLDFIFLVTRISQHLKQIKYSLAICVSSFESSSSLAKGIFNLLMAFLIGVCSLGFFYV